MRKGLAASGYQGKESVLYVSALLIESVHLDVEAAIMQYQNLRYNKDINLANFCVPNSCYLLAVAAGLRILTDSL